MNLSIKTLKSYLKQLKKVQNNFLKLILKCQNSIKRPAMSLKVPQEKRKRKNVHNK